MLHLREWHLPTTLYRTASSYQWGWDIHYHHQHSILETQTCSSQPKHETMESQEDHDNVPDTGLNADSSVADDSGTSDRSPDSLSTMETGDSSSNMGSSKRVVPHQMTVAMAQQSQPEKTPKESDTNSALPSPPRQTSTPCTEAVEPASIPSRSPSPSSVDNSMTVRQFYREQTGHAPLRVQEKR